jgi:hypothetical protein
VGGEEIGLRHGWVAWSERLAEGMKKPRRNAVFNSSFELLRNRWDPLEEAFGFQ